MRGDYCVDIGRNLCHGSDSAEASRYEINLWFKDEKDLIDWSPMKNKLVMELPEEGACV